MANTFTCEGTIKNIKNEVQAGVYVKFRITSAGTDTEDNVVYPKGTVDVLTDASGNFSQDLWINGDSGRSAVYEIELPTQREKIEVIIPSSVEGTTVRLEDIIELYETGGTPQGGTAITTSEAYTDAFAADPTANASFSKAAWLVDLNVEDGATADQTGAEIKALYEAEADTNEFSDAEQTKLSGIETSATADQTGAEIKALYD